MIEVPVHIIAGTSDLMVSVKECKRTYDDLVNSKGKTFTTFDIGHMSFNWGKDMPHLNKIIELLEQK